MVGFEWGLFLRLHARALRDGLGPAALPRPLRALALLGGMAIFLTLQLVHRVGFLLDDLLFPGWRRQPIEDPVFIVGVPRSGTTFLHRLLAEDRERFTSMRLWEIAFAPSVTARVVLRGLRALDRLLGDPLLRAYRGLRARVGTRLEGIHHVDLLEPEEDELLMFIPYATPFLSMILPYPDLVDRYGRFDTELPAAERERLMGFYRDCVRRHLYAEGRGRRFLSKNPAFSSKVRSLREFFPDARVLIPLRTPLETVPSFLSLLRAAGRGSAERPDFPLEERVESVLSLMEHFYLEPVDAAAVHFPDAHRVIDYRALLADLEGEVAALEEVLGGTPSEEFRARVAAQAPRSRGHRSGHRYRLEDYGLDRATLRARLEPVFERYSFE